MTVHDLITTLQSLNLPHAQVRVTGEVTCTNEVHEGGQCDSTVEVDCAVEHVRSVHPARVVLEVKER